MSPTKPPWHERPLSATRRAILRPTALSTKNYASVTLARGPLTWAFRICTQERAFFFTRTHTVAEMFSIRDTASCPACVI